MSDRVVHYRVEEGVALIELDYLDPFRAHGGAAAGGSGDNAQVTSPMPGRIVAVAVAEGDVVSEGDTVVVVEAMKMANELRSPIKGRISAVHCSAGEAVEGGTPLVEIEPS